MKTNKIDVSCLMCHYSRESEIDHGFCMLLMKMTSTKNSNSFWRAQLTTFALLSAGYASYTYNRKSVSFVLPHLLKNGLLDKSSAGLIFSCQNSAVTISKFLCGVLSDKISSKWLFFSGLIFSGGSTILFSAGSSLKVFAVLWFLNGIAQGGGWPMCAKLLKQWFPPGQLGTFWSALAASSNVSGLLCPFLAMWIISQFEWEASLIVSGGLTMVCALCVLLFLHDSPLDAGFKEDYSPKTDKEKESDHPSSDWKDLVRSPFLWLVSGTYLAVYACKTSVTDWGQLYLMEDLGHSHFIGTSFITAVETGGFFGGLAAGYITDWLMKRSGHSLEKGNPRMMAVFCFMAGISAHLFFLTAFITSSTSQTIIVMVGFGLGACLFACNILCGIVASESYPSHLSGTAHAIVALAANVGAILSGLPASYIAEMYNWRAIFVILQILAAATALLMAAFRNLSPVMTRLHSQKKTQ